MAPTIDVQVPSEIFNVRLYAVAVIASMGAFIFGYDLAFIGTTITLQSFRRDFGLLDASRGERDAFAANIVSCLQAGCFFGSLAVAWSADRFGRRSSLMLAGVFFCVGSLMQTVACGSSAVVFTGRAVGGIGVGAASGLVPLYVAELSPSSIRGRLVGLYEISVQLGTCLGFWIVYAVKKTMSKGSPQWVTPFALQLIPGGLLILGMLFVPESPRWIAQHKGRLQATRTLATLRNLDADHEYIQAEIGAICAQIEEDIAHGGDRGTLHQLRLLARKGYRNRIIIGIWIFIFMQMAGSNAINYFSPAVFESIGLKSSDTSLYATGIYGVVRLVAIVVAMHYVVDRFGRKSMLMAGAAVMAIAMWYVGTYEKIVPPTSEESNIQPAGYAAIVMIYIFALGFCFSYAGVPWIYTAEIFVPYMITKIKYGTFFVFASFTTVSIIFVYICVPETKGLDLEEMDILFGVPLRRSTDEESSDLGEKSAAALRLDNVS